MYDFEQSIKVFEYVKKLKSFTQIPITVLVYVNLVYQRGIGKFYREAKEAGIDGVLVPDVPVEEATPYVAAAKKVEVDPIFLVTQTTTNKRLKKILQYAHGYLYLVSVLGVMGARERLRSETLSLRVKSCTDLPIAVGFGISKCAHVLALQKAHVDGYIVGSALIRIIEENIGNNKKLKVELLKFVQGLTNHTFFL